MKRSDAPESTSTPSGDASPPASAHEGQLVASPALGENGAVPETQVIGQTPASTRATRQALTGRAARELPSVSASPIQLTWRQLRKNRMAVLGGVTLLLMYAMALFAPFLAPYNPTNQSPGGQNLTFHPPMRLRFVDRAGKFSLHPFVYQTQQQFTEERDIIYPPVAEQPRPLRFFVRGSDYNLFGLIPTNVHLFGVDNGYVYLLGTDQEGRDYFSRLLIGSQISLSVGLIAILITFTLGMLVGGISGFYGGVVDDIIQRGCEILMSVPDFYLLLALAAALPTDWDPVKVYLLIIVILSFVGWAGMARIVRGLVLSVREREYVEAGRALGVGDFRLIVRHILPSTFTYAIVAATMSVPAYILGEAGLSFLGLGIRDPMPSWGNMLSTAQQLSVLERYEWILAPGFMIFITTLAFNFLGDGLRDALDPKSRKLG